MYTINLWCPVCHGYGGTERAYAECCRRYQCENGYYFCCGDYDTGAYPEECEACHGSGAGEMYLELNGVLKKEEMLL